MKNLELLFFILILTNVKLEQYNYLRFGSRDIINTYLLTK